MPKKYTFLAFTNPTSGNEDEYNKWYDEHHLIDATVALEHLVRQTRKGTLNGAGVEQNRWIL